METSKMSETLEIIFLAIFEEYGGYTPDQISRVVRTKWDILFKKGKRDGVIAFLKYGERVQNPYEIMKRFKRATTLDLMIECERLPKSK